MTSSTRFKKGHTPWNKGTKGLTSANSGSFKKGVSSNEKHLMWKGDEASYTAKHQWIHRHFGKANSCEHCYDTNAKRYEWANISGKYTRDISDWLQLCVTCHRIFDGHAYRVWESRRKKCV